MVAPEWCGRDAGKHFVVTERSAYDAEQWAWAMFFALKGTSGFVPDEVARLGMVGVAIRGINAFLASDVDPARLRPLMDEMLVGIQIVRDKRHPDVLAPLLRPPPADDPYPDIEEVATIGWLRSEVLRIHTNFSFVGALLEWWSTAQKLQASQTTQT